MAYGTKYHYHSELKMIEPGVYRLSDGRWLVRARSSSNNQTLRNSVKSLGVYKTKSEADAVFQNHKLP